MVINKVMFLQLNCDAIKLFSLTPQRIFLTLIYIVIPGSGQGRTMEETESTHIS